MDKVIIDRVDVSGCDFYNDCRCSAQEHYAEGEFLWAEECEECPDCYYKQLKRKEQECNELKADIQSRTMCITCERELQNCNLKAENERLKEENYQLQKDCQICENFIDFIPCKPIRDMDYDLQKVISQRDNYYQALQEIREICKNSYTSANEDYYRTADKIQDKINEVIGAE